MTVTELIEALSDPDIPKDAIVDVACDDSDRRVSGIENVLTIPDGPHAGSWVTLGLD